MSNGGAPQGAARQREARQRWRLVVARAAAGTTQRDVERAWEAALVASGLPWAPSSTRAAPRLAFGAPLPTGIGGEAELVDLFLAERLPMYQVREAVERSIPLGDRLLDLHDVWLGEPGLPSLVVGADYRATLGPVDVAALRRAVARFLDARSVPTERRKGDRVRTLDLRRLVDDIACRPTQDGVVLGMRLRHDPDLGNARAEDVLAALRDLGAGPIDAVAVVRERLRLAGDDPQASI